IIPRIVPVIRCGHVSSGKCAEAGMNDLKFAASGFVGRAPTMSGNSCGGFALSIVDIYGRFQKPRATRKQVMFTSFATRRSDRLAFSKGEGRVRDHLQLVGDIKADPSP